MSLFARLAYRSRQFRRVLRSPKAPLSDSILQPFLSPPQILLFRRMHFFEQAHSFQVLQSLRLAGHTDPDLLAAALLHDVGKILAPLSLMGRVIVVIGKHFFPKAAERWGDGEPHGLRRPFMTAYQHPAWGADLAFAAGASPRTCELIRRHQDSSASDDPMLASLQSVDDES
jgi:hypothetical protein